MTELKPNDQSWFTLLCVLRHDDRGAYEERITLWRTATFDEAIARAEREARDYAGDLGNRRLHRARTGLALQPAQRRRRSLLANQRQPALTGRLPQHVLRHRIRAPTARVVRSLSDTRRQFRVRNSHTLDVCM